MATSREIIVRLRAEVADYQKAMAAAAKSTEGLGVQNKKTSKDATVSAEQTRQAWTSTGTTLLAVGAAVDAVGVAAAKTGIDYNTLQQTSRAALTTLLGSAEAANAQMDKLDVFARTSPFSKAVFITAQQQLIGFGMAAKNVIPTLDAIQNAVAAVGGSNDDVAQLAQIIAKVGASGKITAEDLNQFGDRGVDAATLIGSQMGKTGAQIRTEITAGTLGADAAITALTAGMMEKFGGASANVKKTFTGATDRVASAWRDLSGELAAPLVGPLGGGVATTALNKLADDMRAFQSLPQPVKITAEAITGLFGGVATLGGGFMTITPKIQAFNAKLNDMHVSSSAVWKGIGIGAGALGIATIAFEVWAQAQEEAKRQAAALADTLDKQTGAITDSTGAFIRDELVKSGAAKAYKELGGDVADLAAAALGTSDAMARVNTVLEVHKDEGQWHTILGTFAGASDQINTVRDSLGGMKTAVADGTSAWQLNAEMAGTAGNAQNDATDAATAATTAMEDQFTALMKVVDANQKASGAALSERDAQRNLEAAYTGVSESVERQTSDLAQHYVQQGMGEQAARKRAEAEVAVANKLDITTAAGQANQAALDNVAKAGWDLVTSMQANGDTQVSVQATMLATRGRFLLLAASLGMSAGEASTLANKLGLIPARVTSTVAVQTEQAQASLNAWLRDNASHRINVAVGAGGSGGITRATGGLITGPGTGTSDSILARVSNKEYIVKADAVQHYGPAFFDSLNTMRFASGGHVGSGSSAGPTVGATTSNITLNAYGLDADQAVQRAMRQWEFRQIPR